MPEFDPFQEEASETEVIALNATAEYPRPAGAKPNHAPLALRKNFSWVLVGTMLYAVCNWAMTIALAKMGTTKEVGYYQAGVAITQPIILAAMLQLRSVMLTDHSDKHRYGQYLGLRIVTSVLALAIMIGVALTYSDRITTWVVIVTGIGVCWDAISDILYGFVQRYQRMDRMGASLLIKGFLSIGLFIACYLVTKNVIFAVLGSAFGSLLTVCFWDIPTTISLARALKHSGKQGPMLQLRPTFEPKALWELTCISFALGCTIVLVTFNTYLTRYFVFGELGVASMGIYSSLAQLVNVVGTMVMSLVTAAVPPMTEKFRDGDRKGFLNLFNKCMLVAGALGAGALLVSVFLGHFVLLHLFKPVYAQHTSLFVWIMVVGCIFYISWPITNALTVFRAFKIQLWTAVASLVASLGAAYVLVPRFGLLGAAWAFLASMLVRLLFSAWAFAVEMKRNFPDLPALT